MSAASVVAGTEVVVELDADMTIINAADRRTQLLEALTQAQEAEATLRLDLSAITELDTSGLQLLLLVKRECLAIGCPLVLDGHSRTVLDVLDIAHLTPDLDPADLARSTHAKEPAR